MVLLPVVVIAASLVGSIHCVAMCGGLALAFTSTRGQAIAYHLGRLITYLCLGLVAGMVATYLSWMGLACMVVLVLWMAQRLWRGRPLHLAIALPFVNSWFSHPLRAMTQNNARSITPAFLGGIFTGLLPCGWLYAFVALAGTAGSLLRSELVIGSFWLGTLPLLGVAPIWLNRVAGQKLFTRRRLAAVLLAVFALGSAGYRMLQAYHQSCH